MEGFFSEEKMKFNMKTFDVAGFSDSVKSLPDDLCNKSKIYILGLCHKCMIEEKLTSDARFGEL